MTITLLTTSLASLQALLLTTCSAYWSFVLLASGFGLCTGLWVACETPLIINTLSFHRSMEDISAHERAGITLVICTAIMPASALAYSAATLVRRKTAARVGYEEIS